MFRITTWLRQHKRDVLIVLLLLVVAGAPRLLDLGTFLTADEKNWIGRSYEFIRAFKDWRFNEMLLTTHPGVTTMWLTGAAVTVKILVSHIPFSFGNLNHFVTAAQLPVALLNTLLVPVMYGLLRALTRQRAVPLVASLFIALNPFLIGYSRVVHVDAMLAGFLFTAALATLLYVKQGYSRRWLLVSAALSALALLTKAPAIFIVPYLILSILVWEGRSLWRREVLIARLRDIVLWALVVGLTVVILWPAMLWVPDPRGNVLLLKRDISQAAATPHHMSESYRIDVAYYMGTLVTRTTPLVLLLMAAVIVTLLARRGRWRSEAISTKMLWLLVAYVFFFVVMMMLGAKKGDRYILPVYPALDVLAAVGIAGMASWFGVRRIMAWRSLVVVAVIYLASVVVYYHPYAIAYSNPLWPDNLSQSLGWGEGLEQVGAWLNDTSPEAVVASWYPEELGAYTTAQVAHINAHEQGKIQYVVLYRNMFGRAADHPANDFIDEYYSKREPVFVATVADKEFAWVYEKRVYERVIGELLPEVVVEQEIVVDQDSSLSGLDVMVATYSGRADAGWLRIRVVVDEIDVTNELIKISDIEDNQWVGVSIPNNPKVFNVVVSAEGTSPDNAPTVRYTRDHDYRRTQMKLSGAEKQGDLAVRLRFDQDGQEVNEQHTKLLR